MVPLSGLSNRDSKSTPVSETAKPEQNKIILVNHILSIKKFTLVSTVRTSIVSCIWYGYAVDFCKASQGLKMYHT